MAFCSINRSCGAFALQRNEGSLKIMLNVALIGVGNMGRGHLENLIRFTNEGELIRLVAVCDIRQDVIMDEKEALRAALGNYSSTAPALNWYSEMDVMFEREAIDMVVLALPTYMHCDVTLKCLKKGYHVFCEKPMALTVGECDLMIEMAKICEKKLMIGQCLRFRGEYDALKRVVTSQSLGRPVAGYFYRGGESPAWADNNWFRKKEYGGGAICDQHVHEIDMIHNLFGMPKAVNTVAKVMREGSGYDTVSTNYIYNEGYAVNSQVDWALEGMPFSMSFRVNFERGSVYLDDSGFRVCPRGGLPYTPEYSKENAYYAELEYFAKIILNSSPNMVNPPEDSRNTIKILAAEIRSADNGSVVTMVNM